MAFGLSAATVGLIGAGAGLAGAYMASNSAGDAADAQRQGAAASDATQRYQYDTTRADNAPFRETGLAAKNRLAYLLGLPGGAGGGQIQSRDQIRAQLAGGFTTPGTAATQGIWGEIGNNGDRSPNMGFTGGTAAVPGSIDEAGLQAAVQAQYDRQQGQQQAQSADPAYGSLNRRFASSDLNADPVYQSGLQFGLDQGTQGINRQAAAGGSLLSGATLKALTRFGNDYGNTKANDSYNRFNNDNTQTYNRLASLSDSGQIATNQVSAAGQNMANSISQNQIGMGNARASGYIAQGNALQNGINGAVSGFGRSNAMNNLFSPPVFDGGYSVGQGSAYGGNRAGM